MATNVALGCGPRAPARITAGGVLVRDNRILLARRSPFRSYYPGVWDFVGGHCEGAETPEETLRRELAEELGIVALCIHNLGAFREPWSKQHSDGYHHFFAVTAWSGEPQNRAPDEHDEIAWFSEQELSSIPLAAAEYAELLSSVFRTYCGSGTPEAHSGLEDE